MVKAILLQLQSAFLHVAVSHRKAFDLSTFEAEVFDLSLSPYQLLAQTACPFGISSWSLWISYSLALWRFVHYAHQLTQTGTETGQASPGPP